MRTKTVKRVVKGSDNLTIGTVRDSRGIHLKTTDAKVDRRTIKKSDGPAYTDRPRATKYRPGADYISNGGQEFVITRSGALWYIHRYRGGELHKNLSGAFSSFNKAEESLVSFLRRTDNNGYARYPGKESRYGPFNNK